MDMKVYTNNSQCLEIVRSIYDRDFYENVIKLYYCVGRVSTRSRLQTVFMTVV